MVDVKEENYRRNFWVRFNIDYAGPVNKGEYGNNE